MSVQSKVTTFGDTLRLSTNYFIQNMSSGIIEDFRYEGSHFGFDFPKKIILKKDFGKAKHLDIKVFE